MAFQPFCRINQSGTTALAAAKKKVVLQFTVHYDDPHLSPVLVNATAHAALNYPCQWSFDFQLLTKGKTYVWS